MNLRLFGDKIAIKVEEEKKEIKTGSGIVLPQSTQGKKYIGKVVATGDGLLLSNGTVVPLTVKTGDTVIYEAFAGTDVVRDDETIKILSEKNVLAIVDDIE